jgi:RNA polymerase sigma-70 factor (ECF subfamily)
VTSQVFFKALKNIGRFHYRGVPFSSWLYRIAANEIADSYRETKRRRIYFEEDLEVTDTSNPSPESELAQAEEELHRHEEFLSLHQNISKLSFRYQEVITLRYFEHKPLEEIGLILGKSEGTVKSLLHRGLEKLRKLMKQSATF